MNLESIKSSLVKGKKVLWDFSFPMKVVGRQATLGGLGEKAITLKLQTSQNYPHLDIKCFLNWEHFDDFTKEEKALIDILLKELNSK